MLSKILRYWNIIRRSSERGWIEVKGAQVVKQLFVWLGEERCERNAVFDTSWWLSRDLRTCTNPSGLCCSEILLPILLQFVWVEKIVYWRPLGWNDNVGVTWQVFGIQKCLIAMIHPVLPWSILWMVTRWMPENYYMSQLGNMGECIKIPPFECMPIQTMIRILFA